MKGFIISVMLLFAVGLLQGQESAPGVSSAFSRGTEVQAAQPEVKVFPNPVHNRRFTVETGNALIREIRITNIAGSQIYLKKFSVPVQRFEITTDNIPDGVYLLRVSNSGNTAKTVKLLVSNPK